MPPVFMRVHRSVCGDEAHSQLCFVCFLVSAKRQKMVRVCKFPNCRNKMKRHAPCSFHRLPLNDMTRLKLWLVALHIDPDTSIKKLRAADIRVCGEHFDREDYFHRPGSNTHKHYYLRPTAVPRVIKVAKLQDNRAATDRPPGQVRSTGSQVNETETCSATMEKPTRQHIVDEEAILQLMKDCPMCNRKCRCTKHTRGPYLIVYQSCYFCHYQRKWASQPEAKDMNIHKTQTPAKKKPKPKNKMSIKAKSPPSKLNKSHISETVSKSHDPLET